MMCGFFACLIAKIAKYIQTSCDLLAPNNMGTGKPISLRRGPDGKLIRDGAPRAASDPPRTVQSSVRILLVMIAAGVTGLVLLSLVIIGAAYCVNHPEGVQRVVNRVLRRKEGQDKE
jgi:hypothetical protein